MIVDYERHVFGSCCYTTTAIVPFVDFRVGAGAPVLTTADSKSKAKVKISERESNTRLPSSSKDSSA